MCPRPPISTLFPYTTLFRSYLIINSTSLKEWVDLANNIELPKGKYIGETPPRGATIQVTKDWVLGALDVQLIEVSRDRKSTRLNSSHVKISYAVFCLKKKKP